MSSYSRFGTFFTKLPSTTKMTLSLIGIAALSHFFGDRANKRLKENNLKNNINILSGTKADWSCFYLAKQYHEECDDLNRLPITPSHAYLIIIQIFNKYDSNIMV